MSWVTRTTAFAVLASSRTRSLALLPEDLVAGGQDLVEEQDVGVHRGGDGETEACPHPGGVGLDRGVDELADVGVLDDRLRPAAHLAVVDPQEGAGQEDVVAAAQGLVEAGAQGQQARHVTADLDHALGRGEDPGQGLEEGALARAVRADDRERLAVDQPEGDVLERPERPFATGPLGHRRQGLAERVLLGQAQVVADPEVADVDRRREPVTPLVGAAGCRAHQRTFAKAGSTRLKNQTRDDQPDTAAAPGRSTGR